MDSRYLSVIESHVYGLMSWEVKDMLGRDELQ